MEIKITLTLETSKAPRWLTPNLEMRLLNLSYRRINKPLWKLNEPVSPIAADVRKVIVDDVKPVVNGNGFKFQFNLKKPQTARRKVRSKAVSKSPAEGCKRCLKTAGSRRIENYTAIVSLIEYLHPFNLNILFV